MSDKDVKIVVKNVYAPSETQQFVVVDSLAVRTLKEMLQAALPGNPQPKHQKLIFGGKICDDSHTLAKVLASQNQNSPKHGTAADEDEAPFVFHLMVSGPTTPVARPPTPPASTPTPAPLAAPVSVSTPAAPVPAAPAMATVGATPGPHPSNSAPSVPPAGFFGGFPATAGAQPSQASAYPRQPPHPHQHLYTQAFLMQQQAMILSQIHHLQTQLQHHHHHQATAEQPPASAHGAHQAHAPYPHYGHFGHHNPYMYGMPHPAAYGHVGAAPGGHAPGFPAPPVAPVAPAAADAGAAPAAVDPRDRNPIIRVLRELAPLVDIRLAMKMSFMLFIIGQDTPFDRLIVLALMSFGAYLHITGILAKIFEMLKRVSGPQANADADAAANANNANGNAVAQAPGRLGALTQHLRISPDRGFVQDVRYFVVGLLLSLVPAWHPQPLAADGAAAARPEPIVPDAGAEIPLQGI